MEATINQAPLDLIDISNQKPITPGSEQFHWAGLDQIRMFAALAVIVHHIEQTKYLFGWQSFWNYFPIVAAGKEGVRLFFVLSGFLITFLLIAELKNNQTINVKKFYLRRMLRIWPLYYLIVMGAFFILPAFLHPAAGSVKIAFFQTQLYDHFVEKLAYFIFFLPNICLDKYPPVLFGAQCWSLGMEWQLYLIWPFILLLFRKTVLPGIVAALAIKPVLLWSINCFLEHSQWLPNMLQILKQSIFNFEAEPFIVGALAAWCMTKSPQFVKAVVVHPLTRSFFTVAILVCFLGEFPLRSQLITASFALLVLSFAHRSLNLGFFTGTTMYLGCISYGLYMFHPTVLTFVAQGLTNARFSLLQNNLAIYLLTITITALIASISYKFFEKPFLRMKNSLAIIKTNE